MTAPLVSVVIPTRGRPNLLARALDSVAVQTHRPVEIIVVIDGPDMETSVMLKEREQDGLRWVELPASCGSNAARNRGIREAVGQYVALLDDDDEFLAGKIETQVGDLKENAWAFSFCQAIIRSPLSEVVWPRRAPNPGEPFGDYLFARSSLFAGEGKIQTSMLVVPRDILLRIPFDPDLPRYQEADWALRAAANGVHPIWCSAPLVVWNIGGDRETITSRYANDVQFAIDWIHDRRNLVSRRAYAGYLLSRASSIAAASGQRQMAWEIWRDAWRDGSPRPIDVVLFVGKMAIPTSLRAFLGRHLSGARRRAARNG